VITHITVITGVEVTTRTRKESHPPSLTVEDAFAEMDVVISGAAQTTSRPLRGLPYEQ
jgi:hypothetical protein